jgi:alkylhydroperoxidase/carboxymuconolactone decarboxylase family protein YurZ
VRRALEAGVAPAEIRHVVALAPPTMGLPTTVAVYTWVEEVLGKGTANRGRRA